MRQQGRLWEALGGPAGRATRVQLQGSCPAVTSGNWTDIRPASSAPPPGDAGTRRRTGADRLVPCRGDGMEGVGVRVFWWIGKDGKRGENGGTRKVEWGQTGMEMGW
jgi:hypothetical protein